MEDNPLSNKIKALIIDDKKVIGDFFNYVLGADGHDITIVHNPNEALDLIKNRSFDIAFCDIVMPQKDGLTLLQEIKTTYPELPVVMMSGFMLESQRRKAFELGAVTCLDKPFQKEDLQTAIKSATGIEI